MCPPSITHNTTEDYTLTTPFSLTISGLATGGESCFSIEVNDDNLFEDSEDFTIHLSTDDASVTLHTIYATVTITDNDGMFQSFFPYVCTMYICSISVMQLFSTLIQQYVHKVVCSVSNTFLHPHLSEVVIGFEERFYGPLTESEMVEVCLAVLSGAVGTVINVGYSSFDGTANSK